jgi:hypothetical protein
VKISNIVREKYIEICHKSSFKCDTYADVEYKIERGVRLGTITEFRRNGQNVYGYYNLRFVTENDTVIDMYVDMDGKCFEVSEKIKNTYNKLEMKIVV